MIFDATVTVIQMRVDEPEPDENGNYDPGAAIMLNATLGLLLQTGQGVIPVPAANIRMPMDADNAKKYGQELVDAAAKMPSQPKSSLVIPGSESEVENVARAAKLAEQFKG